MEENEVVAYMEGATSETDWNARADEVKHRCGGYPDFWYEAVILSDLAKRIGASWEKPNDAEIHLTTLRDA